VKADINFYQKLKGSFCCHLRETYLNYVESLLGECFCTIVEMNCVGFIIPYYEYMIWYKYMFIQVTTSNTNTS